MTTESDEILENIWTRDKTVIWSHCTFRNKYNTQATIHCHYDSFTYSDASSHHHFHHKSLGIKSSWCQHWPCYLMLLISCLHFILPATIYENLQPRVHTVHRRGRDGSQYATHLNNLIKITPALSILQIQAVQFVTRRSCIWQK